ncbi:DUF6817 domain-containing protein [Catellatospora bangladeshensis]|uniref:DUF6817 domain-containing protein n=1 Tax=Catellatospora bangladeshensis TaxID=310355 RepID=UPI00360D738F
MSAQDVQALLRERGAATIAHPGGTLHAHLVRVHDRLAAHGLPEATALAGLAHAAYGTDGFATALLTLDERDLLRAAAGEHAELIVYRYGATLRKATWRQLASTRQVHDRFTGTAETLTPDQLRPWPTSASSTSSTCASRPPTSPPGMATTSATCSPPGRSWRPRPCSPTPAPSCASEHPARTRAAARQPLPPRLTSTRVERTSAHGRSGLGRRRVRRVRAGSAGSVVTGGVPAHRRPPRRRGPAAERPVQTGPGLAQDQHRRP